MISVFSRLLFYSKYLISKDYFNDSRRLTVTQDVRVDSYLSPPQLPVLLVGATPQHRKHDNSDKLLSAAYPQLTTEAWSGNTIQVAGSNSPGSIEYFIDRLGDHGVYNPGYFYGFFFYSMNMSSYMQMPYIGCGKVS